jgi:hypothetical protein
LANKHYKSIIRLFDHCGISAGDDFNLSRAKKQLQAEFRVAREGMIEIDGNTYTQHEVFDEIENEDFPKRLSFHKQIWDNPQILQLLEKNIMNFATINEAFKPFWNNKDFDNFFSPYFTGPFNYISRTLLASAKLREMGDLLAYEDFLQPAEREEAFRPLRIFLDENIRLLRNVNKESYKLIKQKITHWIDGEWYMFFNNLPHEFYDLKLEIATKLVNIGVDIQRFHKPDCKKMSTQLVSLTDMPDNLRSTILTNHEAYTSSRGIRLKGGWWVVWIIFILIKAFGSKSCEGTSNSNRIQPYQFQVADSVVRKFRDSAFKIRSKNPPENHTIE